eukprot:8872660-Pyramimonas_sp.AAC.1
MPRCPRVASGTRDARNRLFLITAAVGAALAVGAYAWKGIDTGARWVSRYQSPLLFSAVLACSTQHHRVHPSPSNPSTLALSLSLSHTHTHEHTQAHKHTRMHTRTHTEKHGCRHFNVPNARLLEGIQSQIACALRMRLGGVASARIAIPPRSWSTQAMVAIGVG